MKDALTIATELSEQAAKLIEAADMDARAQALRPPGALVHATGGVWRREA